MIKKPQNQVVRMILAMLILTACSVLILYSGPGFNFVVQVILSFILLFFLLWLVT